MDSLRRLEELFAHFPGIGPRQARRFVYYLLSKSPSFISEFTSLVEEVRKASSTCNSCHRLFMGKSALSLCTICSDQKRTQTTLMIVARDSDFETVEKSGAYQGLYFILGGTVPLMDTEPEKRIRLQALLERISSSPALSEIILSFNTTPDGEHTATIVKNAIQELTLTKPITVSILGRGLSTGAELEYVDGETIRSALRNRK
jgi:recombination protein RecR